MAFYIIRHTHSSEEAKIKSEWESECENKMRKNYSLWPSIKYTFINSKLFYFATFCYNISFNINCVDWMDSMVLLLAAHLLALFLFWWSIFTTDHISSSFMSLQIYSIEVFVLAKLRWQKFNFADRTNSHHHFSI